MAGLVGKMDEQSKNKLIVGVGVGLCCMVVVTILVLLFLLLRRRHKDNLLQTAPPPLPQPAPLRINTSAVPNGALISGGNSAAVRTPDGFTSVPKPLFSGVNDPFRHRSGDSSLGSSLIDGKGYLANSTKGLNPVAFRESRLPLQSDVSYSDEGRLPQADYAHDDFDVRRKPFDTRSEDIHYANPGHIRTAEREVEEQTARFTHNPLYDPHSEEPDYTSPADVRQNKRRVTAPAAPAASYGSNWGDQDAGWRPEEPSEDPWQRRKTESDAPPSSGLRKLSTEPGRPAGVIRKMRGMPDNSSYHSMDSDDGNRAWPSEYRHLNDQGGGGGSEAFRPEYEPEVGFSRQQYVRYDPNQREEQQELYDRYALGLRTVREIEHPIPESAIFNIDMTDVDSSRSPNYEARSIGSFGESRY